MKRIKRIMLSGMPVVIIGGLLYAGLFVKPKPVGNAVEQPLVERGDAFYGIATLPDGALWAAGSNGKILYSTDAGTSWRRQAAPGQETLQDIAAWDSRRAVAVGNEGVVLTTVDAGQSWTTAQTPKAAAGNKLMRVQTNQDGSAWAVGSGGVLMRSRDYGKHWEAPVPGEDAAWNGIALQGRRGCVVGEFGRISITADGGESWTSVASPVKQSLMSVRFNDAGQAVAVGLSGIVLVSDDGGSTWKPAGKATDEDLFDVAWDGKRWIAVGDKGAVLIGEAGGQAGGKAGKWRLARLAPDDRGWYTRVRAQNGKYYVAGSRLGAKDANAL
ncbi:WD40/YVTN/BNR-like repeat-containing protein [Cupriavidus pinatubonensis]|uniref:WD40/YVTN/BNR-like repeat-containing protein n=1 Tax=Cupriavidus pinatubonensis TaxID=248026 RepID=UPI00112AF340|nr:YCF48-related protein [Cupriavidus pinatubonensis]TPQ32888.1 glycosyl hydrolase [Cupriavidus pinatubonensis]